MDPQIQTRDFKGLGTLKALPYELRDMIYRPVIAAGHMEIRRVSHGLHEETARSLKCATHHLELDIPGQPPMPSPPQNIFDKIMSFEIGIDTMKRFNAFQRCDPSPILLSSDPSIRRQRCVIEIKVSIWFGYYFNSTITDALSKLTNFHEVVIKILFFDEESVAPPPQNWRNALMQQTIEITQYLLTNEVAPSLGMPCLEGGFEHPCVVFRPRDRKEAVGRGNTAGGGSGGLGF